MSRLQEIIYHIILGFFRLYGMLSPTWGIKSGHVLGRIWFAADRRHRKIALNNLQRALGREKSASEIRLLARQVFQHIARILYEIGWYLSLHLEDLDRSFTFNGLPHLKDAYAKGKGVLILTAHVGNWELMPVVSAMTGFRGSIVYRPVDFKPLNQFLIHSRTRFGAQMIPRSRSMRRILHRLNQGDLVAFLMDQNVGWLKGVFVDFFGHRACTSKGLALLALKTGAPVLPLFLVRGNKGFQVEIGPQVPLIRSGDKTRDVDLNTQQYNDIIEAFVRRYPEQWFWVHRRWKTRPYRPWPRHGAP